MVKKFNREVSPHSLPGTVLIAGEFAHSVLQAQGNVSGVAETREMRSACAVDALLGRSFVVAVSIQ